jgi:hypothetical protein
MEFEVALLAIKESQSNEAETSDDALHFYSVTDLFVSR